ncbi:MAG: hypothetical protein BWY06_01701 [Candidatus Latescibacteria bacterium ADurb.Bin168]|nr:MAG: hypothetical protein BWY06_01701 [Candidatus Latescibacteria bacterium ADurb.Bin168]
MTITHNRFHTGWAATLTPRCFAPSRTRHRNFFVSSCLRVSLSSFSCPSSRLRVFARALHPLSRPSSFSFVTTRRVPWLPPKQGCLAAARHTATLAREGSPLISLCSRATLRLRRFPLHSSSGHSGGILLRRSQRHGTTCAIGQHQFSRHSRRNAARRARAARSRGGICPNR